MNNTLISVIVPIYNVEVYLPQCIDSIIQQTYRNLEVILVDDGSTDRSGIICNQYAKKDFRIKVIHKNNGGLSDARNTGLDHAKGEYIGFIDSDDYIEKNMYEQLIFACKKYNKKIAMCGRNIVYKNNNINMFTLKRQECWDAKKAVANLLSWKNIDSAACDKIFYASCFHNVRFPLNKINEDIFIMVKIINNADGIVHIGDAKYNYRFRPGSITSQKFSTKKMDLLIASEEVKYYCIAMYPDLKEVADAFYLRAIILIGGMFQKRKQIKEFEKEYNNYRQLLIRNIKYILMNKHIPKNLKIKSILLFLSIYPEFRKIYKYFK